MKLPLLCAAQGRRPEQEPSGRTLNGRTLNEIKHAARVLSRYRDARRTRILRIRLRLTVRVNHEKLALACEISRVKRKFLGVPLNDE